MARRSRERLGERLTLIDPIDYAELRGVSFYELFIDRKQWPRMMRQGYEAATRALDPFRRVARRSRAA